MYDEILLEHTSLPRIGRVSHHDISQPLPAPKQWLVKEEEKKI